MRAPRAVVTLAVTLALSIAALLAATAAAATLEGDDILVVTAEETIEDNLYAFGQTITVEGTIEGDLISAGSSVVIAPTGSVSGDVLAAGREVRIEGRVGGDVRAAGFVVHVGEEGSIAGELVAAGYGVGLDNGAVVQGDALWAGYQGVVDGEIGDDLTFAGAGLEVTGVVGGNVDADVEAEAGGPPPTMFMFGQPIEMPRTVSPGLTIADDATIGGDLTYRSPTEQAPPDAAVQGTVEFTEVERPTEAPSPNPMVSWLYDFLGHYITLLLLGLGAVVAAPRVMAGAATIARREAASSTGWGLVTMAACVLGVLLTGVALMALTLLLMELGPGALLRVIWYAGIVAGVAFTFGLLLAGWIGLVVVGLGAGRAIVRSIESSSLGDQLPSLAVGLAIVALIVTVPLMGFLVKIIVGAVGLGALILFLRSPSETAPPAAV